ncbi:MAG: hypothetical protein ACK6AO_18000 [Planctomycetota bacterium]
MAGKQIATKLVFGAMLAVVMGWCATLSAQQADLLAPGPLTSQDYLKLMEQANAAAGIQASGGNFPGAKARPRGSLETPPPVASPQQQFAQMSPSAGQIRPDAVQPLAPVPTAAIPTASMPTAAIPTAAMPTAAMPTAPMPSPVQSFEPQASRLPTARALPPSQPWTGPHWVGRYATVGLRRPGDESYTLSQAGQLGTFGSDLANQITIGYLTNPIDCYEFSYLGSLNWNRGLDSTGPVNFSVSSNDPQWLAPFQDADLHQQKHSAGYRQYDLNRRWLTDDIGNSSLGLRMIDYSEQYGFRSVRGTQEGLYRIDTSNLLVGMASGMELWRPISQRLAVGGAIDGGLYANFADASIDARTSGGKRAFAGDEDLSLAASFGVHLRTRYQLRSWAGLYGGYRWMVLSGLATVDDQAPVPLSDNISLSTSSDATILFHGFDVGLELKF